MEMSLRLEEICRRLETTNGIKISRTSDPEEKCLDQIVHNINKIQHK